jgi:AcrR family transcriptional regulator
MSQELPEVPVRGSHPVKQSRARETRDRLLAAGFKLLRRKHFDELSVADIARAAGCSVGSFYVRFVDKDQYFLAIAESFRAQRRSDLESLYEDTPRDSLVERALARELAVVVDHANLWRAALKKSVAEPEFWEDFREMGRQSVNRFLERYSQILGRALSEPETEQIRFAFQVVRGTLNNTLLNQPGPLQLEDPVFRRQIERAFRLVSGIE